MPTEHEIAQLEKAHADKVEEQAKDEAADWAILLMDDPIDAEQQARFKHWLAASTANAQAWEQTQRVYTGLGQLTPTTQAQWPSPHSTKEQNHTTSTQAWPTKVSAAPARTTPNRWQSVVGFAMAACLLVAVFPVLQLHWSADYSTAAAEQRTITLEDGSQVFLAPESAIEIAFTRGERHVELLKGDAYFEVSPDANRPFSVDAGGTTATVLGTAFNVHHSGNGTVVSVAHGRVRVDDDSIHPAVSETLTVGERLAVTWGSNAIRSELATDEVAQWRQGELIARNLPISHIVDALRAYHQGIIIMAGDFGQRRVTGLYRLDTPAATLDDLVASHGGSVYQLSPWVLVVSDSDL